LNRIRLVLWIGLLLSFDYQHIYTQSEDSDKSKPGVVQDVVHDARHVYQVCFGLLQSPVTARSSDWYRLLYISAATSTLFFVDPVIQDFAESHQTTLNDNIFKIDQYFTARTGLYASAGIYLTGISIRRERIRLIGLYTAEAILITRAITNALKFSFGRRRPYGGEDDLYFKIFKGNKQKYRSLPSGHTSAAFAFATVTAKSVDNLLWKIFWYTGAGAVGMARIYHNIHWLSDTILSAFIGYSVANYVIHFSDNCINRKSVTLSLALIPIMNGNKIVIYLCF
jgi:membrane-associated phospholipid phosphatase